MSTAPPTPAPPPPPSAPKHEDKQEVTIISHSNLYYWWPVWAVGYILGILTFIDGYRMAVVPKDSEVVYDAVVTSEDKDGKPISKKGEALVVHPSHKNERELSPYVNNKGE